MKSLLTLLLLSPLAFAEDDLPSVLYCSLGASQAEFHFNDNGENWFIYTHLDSTNKIYNKRLSKKVVIKNKNLIVTPKEIFVQFQFALSGLTRITINRVTGGLSQNILPSGQCSTVKHNQGLQF